MHCFADNKREDKQQEALAKALKLLPPENLETLKVLLEHLIRFVTPDNQISQCWTSNHVWGYDMSVFLLALDIKQ